MYLISELVYNDIRIYTNFVTYALQIDKFISQST